MGKRNNRARAIAYRRRKNVIREHVTDPRGDWTAGTGLSHMAYGQQAAPSGEHEGRGTGYTLPEAQEIGTGKHDS